MQNEDVLFYKSSPVPRLLFIALFSVILLRDFLDSFFSGEASQGIVTLGLGGLIIGSVAYMMYLLDSKAVLIDKKTKEITTSHKNLFGQVKKEVHSFSDVSSTLYSVSGIRKHQKLNSVTLLLANGKISIPGAHRDITYDTAKEIARVIGVELKCKGYIPS